MRKLVFAALTGLLLAVGVVSAVQATGGHSKGGAVAVQPAAATTAAQTSGNGSAPCFRGHPVPNPCASSDPQVSLRFYTSSGDTSGCTFKAQITWGDKAKTVQSFHGGPLNQTVADIRHDYARPGTYAINGTVSSDSGFGCNGFTFSLSFVLQHLKAPVTLAALGDSYSAGEGTEAYDPLSGNCHRSPTWAWSELLPKHNPAITKVDLVACSGAKSESLYKNVGRERAQVATLKYLRPQPTVVTVTMGGNDIGFSTLLKDCFLHSCMNDAVMKETEKLIGSERGKLLTDYRSIQQNDPSATILVVGYPQIFDDRQACGHYTWRELTELNKLGAMLNDQVRASAEYLKLNYVDLTGVFRGHEECSKDSWLVPISLWAGARGKQEPAHPNRAGQEAISEAVARYMSEHL